MRIVYFDLETRKLAKDLHKNEQIGWDLLRQGKGGISALAIYDSQDRWLYLHDDTSLPEVARLLEKADVVVGYCSSRFDIPVIEGILGRALRIRFHFDIYSSVARANAERGILGQKGDFTLDSVAKRNLGRGKIEHGAHAPELIRLGRWAKLFNYCADDVHLTHDLFVKLCTDGGLINLNGKFITISLPDWVRSAVVKE